MSIKKLTLGLFVCAALAAPALAETPTERELHSFDYVQSVGNPQAAAVKQDNYSNYRESGEKPAGKHHGKHHHGHKHDGKKADGKKADGKKEGKHHHHHHHKKGDDKAAPAAPATK